MHSLAFHYRAGVSTVYTIVCDTTRAIWEVLQPLVMPTPTEDIWLQIAQDFFNRWNFPLCLGAIDGKHIRIKKPRNSGSKYFNYKGYFSIVLLAVVDATGNFIIVDVGSCGGNSDGGIFEKSAFGKRLSNQTLSVPEKGTLPSTATDTFFVFVADDAFPLKENILKPFSQKKLTFEKDIFNYRLSRARGVVEMAFGNLAQMWRILLHQLEVEPPLATDIVKALTVLHNYVKTKEPHRSFSCTDSPRNNKQAQVPSDLKSIDRPRYRAQHRALETRELFMNYFLSNEGSVSWQEDSIFTKP